MGKMKTRTKDSCYLPGLIRDIKRYLNFENLFNYSHRLEFGTYPAV